MRPKILIVGSGLFGLTIAERIATSLSLEVLIIEKRDHIGGNAWSEFDPTTGIEIHKYGSHLFHTSNELVWKYVNQFTTFTNYQHRVWTKHAGNVFPLPINLATISQFYGKSMNPREARELILSEKGNNESRDASNFENLAINSIGKSLYEAFIKGYTQKQWQVDPQLLPSEVFSRLPIRFNFTHKYFNDKYEGLPENGYMNFLTNIIDNKLIKVETEHDYFKHKNKYANTDLIVYTGPFDEYFDFKFGALGWRTLDFKVEKLEMKDFQGTAVMNYADLEFPFTRIHEFQHLHPERSKKADETIIMTEFSRLSTPADEPYYPIDTQENRGILASYRAMKSNDSKVIFGGRLGTFKYIDMHMAIASALQIFETQIKPRFQDK